MTLLLTDRSTNDHCAQAASWGRGSQCVQASDQEFSSPLERMLVQSSLAAASPVGGWTLPLTRVSSGQLKPVPSAAAPLSPFSLLHIHQLLH